MMSRTRMEEMEVNGLGLSNTSDPVVESRDQTAEHAPVAGPYIEFCQVSKSFGDKHVLDDVSFQVNDGETVCILGRSGVGKSVALQHILGFLKPDSGRVIVAHEDITDCREEDLEPIRKKVTM